MHIKALIVYQQNCSGETFTVMQDKDQTLNHFIYIKI